MGHHRALCDGQTEPETTGSLPIQTPIERLEDRLEIGFGHAGATISHPQHKTPRLRASPCLYRRALTGVLHAVADDILEGALNQLPPHNERCITHTLEAQLTPLGLRFEAGIIGNGGGQIHQINALFPGVAHTSIKTGNGQQLSDQLIKAHRLPLDTVKTGFQPGRILPDQANRRLQTRQR